MRTLTTAALIFMALTACESEPQTGTIFEQCDRTACKSEGRCTVTPYGCEAGSVADCRQSQACISEGRCDIDDGACVAQKVIP